MEINQMGNSTAVICVSPVEGVVIQPYWIFVVSQMVFTLLGMIWSSCGLDWRQRCKCCSWDRVTSTFLAPSKGYFTVVTAYHVLHFAYLIVISFVIDNKDFTANSLWHDYQLLYTRFMNTGVVTVLPNIFVKLWRGKINIYDVQTWEESENERRQYKRLQLCLMGVMLPCFLTHIIPATLAYIYIFFPVAFVLWLPYLISEYFENILQYEPLVYPDTLQEKARSLLQKPLQRIYDLLEYDTWRFLQNFFLAVMAFSFFFGFWFTTATNYAVLLYNGHNYIKLIDVEFHTRSTRCYFDNILDTVTSVVSLGSWIL